MHTHPVPPILRYGLSLLLLIILGLLGCPSWGQGFMVTPMRVELTPRPGEKIEQPLMLHNSGAQPVKLRLTPGILAQTEQGRSRIIDPAIASEDAQRARTCLKWLKIDTTEMEVAPQETRTVKLQITIPPATRGFYSAVIAIENQPKKAGDYAMPLMLQFLIPIMLDIQGAPARERIEVSDVAMQYIAPAEGRPASTRVALTVKNTGETFRWIQGRITVAYPAGDRWRMVTDIALPTYPLLPGAQFQIQQDLARRLPSGRYRLQGRLRASARSVAAVEKEIAFEGDPAVKTITSDISLVPQPSEVAMKAVPGSRHSTVVLITNPSEETIQVDCRVAPPPELVGLIRGGQNAEQFSCAPWVQVTPAQFTLRGGQARNVRLDAMLPAQRDALPDYYANLSIRSTFADGQSGGNMQVPIWVQNTKGSAVAKVLPVTLTIAQQEGNAYAVSGKFVNAGTIHLTPAVKANLVTSTGRVISVQPLQASTSQMLPLTMPEFSGTLDFTKVPEGTYSIRAVLTYGEKAEESISIPVKVEIGEQDVRVVTVLGADGTAPASETPTPDATEAK